MYVSAKDWSWGDGPGVFKSTDGGETWTRMANGMSDDSVRKVVASPDLDEKDTLFAMTKSGIEKSTDGGENWSAVASPDSDLSDLALSPAYASDQTVFVTADTGRVYSSTNGGGGWNWVNAWRGDPRHLALSPDYANDRTVCYGGGWNDSIYCSTDGGATWTQADTGLPGGLNETGTAILFSPPGNLDGVWIGRGASYNTIGPDNVISNNFYGVSINEDAAYNVVAGNLIGTDPTGTFAQSNGDEERNLISGGISGEAIRLHGSNTLSNTVSGNYIGTDISGTAIIGNSSNGIAIHDGARYNVIGGDTPGERNVISGNGGGIGIEDSNTRYNTVSGNYIGTDASGASDLGNDGSGVYLAWGASYNTIGGDTPDERNVISGNDGDGVFIQGAGTMYNTISGNYIGADASGTASIGNGFSGVNISNGATYNVIGGDTAGAGNIIAYNAQSGVLVYDITTMHNSIRRNSIHDNDGMGIALWDGGNAELAAPAITSMGANTVAGTACANCTVEVFSDDADEGRWYEDFAIADDFGHWSLDIGHSPTGPHLTATATDESGNTSEFSSPFLLDLVVAKRASTVIVNPGQALTYTIVVTNNMTESATNVVLTDTLDIWQRATGVTPAGICNITAGGWGGVAVCSLGTMAPGATVVVTLTAQVSSAIPEGEAMFNNVVVVTANETTRSAEAATVSRAPLVYPLGSEPPTLDINRGGNDLVLAQLMEGLYRYRADGSIEPAGATTYTVSADSLVYTVTLRPDAVWSDDQPVTAQHYVDGIIRLLDPDTEVNYYDELMYVIAGAEEFNKGESTDPGAVGVTAVDTYMLKFTLKEPVGHFPSLMALHTTYPVRLDLIGGDPDWTEVGHFVGNGPYTLAEWAHDSFLVLDKNPLYHDASQVSIERIVLPIMSESDQLAAYESGLSDVSATPSDELSRILSDPVLSVEFRRTPSSGIYYLGMNTQLAPTNNITVCKALASAINRTYIVSDVLNMPWREAATSVIPPGIPGYQNGEVGYPFNLAQAQTYLAQAGYPGGARSRTMGSLWPRKHH